jgi:hypothetical protein
MPFRAVSRPWMILALATLAACGASDSPEQQVRALIDKMERAAENRDVAELTQHLSGSFSDANGNGRAEVARYLRGYFIAHQSIHLFTQIEELELPADDEARARVLVGMLGRDAAANAPDELSDLADLSGLAADLHTFEIALRREQGDWKVVFARVIRK